MPEEKSGGKGILIVSGLIISGIIITIILKKQASLHIQHQPPQTISITPILDRIEQLEQQQLKPILDRITHLEGLIQPTPRGGPDSEGFGFPLLEEGHQSSSPAARNIIHHKDGSVTDVDTLAPTSISTFKNNEVRMVSRDQDGFIISTKTIRDAQKGNNVPES